MKTIHKTYKEIAWLNPVLIFGHMTEIFVRQGGTVRNTKLSLFVILMHHPLTARSLEGLLLLVLVLVHALLNVREIRDIDKSINVA